MDDITLWKEFRRLVRTERRSVGSRGYFVILNCLSDGQGKTQREIAERVDIRVQTLSEALSGLEEKGLILRKPAPEDRRAMQVFITEQGAVFRAEREKEIAKRASELFCDMTDAEKETFYYLMKKLNRSLEKESGEEE